MQGRGVVLLHEGMMSIRTSDREGDDRRHNKCAPAEVTPQHDRHERRVEQNEADRVPAVIEQITHRNNWRKWEIWQDTQRVAGCLV